MKQFLIFALFYLSYSQANDYTNYKVYDVIAQKDQLAALMDWQYQEGVDFWRFGGVGRESKVMVSPEVEPDFVNFLRENEVKHKLSIENVELNLQKEKAGRAESRAKQGAFSADNEPNFNVYWTSDEIEAYSIQLAQDYPNIVTRDVIGRSIEGRDIFALRISTDTVFGRRPIIFIDSGIHAREWVTHHATMFLVNQLVTNSSVTEELVSRVDWVIVPNVNPDGYAYSHTNDRMWRKNRRVVNASCTGVDLNRNFRYAWQYLANSCNGQTHPGPEPLSEPETYALTTYMESFRNNLRMYLSTHSFGNYVLWPFGFAFNTYIPNWQEHVAVGERWVNTIYAATGTWYDLGNSADLLYTATGASDDHAVAYANANIAFTLELTGGSYGFIYPEALVFALSRETFLGYRQFGLYIGEQYNYD